MNLDEKKFYDLDNFQENTTMFQTNTNASLKNLEVQIGQMAQAVQKKPKDCMAVILRSDKDLDKKRSEKKNTDEEWKIETGEELEQHSSETTKKKKTTEMQPNKQGKKEKVKAYNPPVSFPQRLQKEKLEEQFSRFLNMFKKIEINIPFFEALT